MSDEAERPINPITRRFGSSAKHHAGLDNKRRVKATEDRKKAFLALIPSGQTVRDICSQLGVHQNTYQRWRQLDSGFRAAADEARANLASDRSREDDAWNLTPAQFAARYFGHEFAPFQIEAISEVERTKLGNILLVQFPPEHGKTTLFEDYANRKLAYEPETRFLVASENTDIASKIMGRVRARMEAFGPSPLYVATFGPFAPQSGESGKPAQTWSTDAFSVYKRSSFDERNFSMEAVGGATSIVSARTDHLHLDDIQSLKTASPARTEKVRTWFHQDALPRAGESGITTIFGTKVADGDFYEQLEDNQDLDGILKVIRYPAIVTDNDTGEQVPLWPERFTMEKLDRIRRKSTGQVWDRCYMMHRSAGAGMFTFSREDVEACRDPERSMLHIPPEGAICIVTLDPNIGGGKNCVSLLEITPDHKLIWRRVWETTNLQANSQVIGQVQLAVEFAKAKGGIVSDVVIEGNNFQKGLIHDESLRELKRKHGFNVRPHHTGWSKYDENLGVASMATSFNMGEIIIPYAADDFTRHWADEATRQLLSWRPYQKGALLRQDMVMTLWFGWLLWRQRSKEAVDARPNTAQWRRSGVPWKPTQSGLLVPIGVR